MSSLSVYRHFGEFFPDLIEDANRAALISLSVLSELTRDDSSMRSGIVQGGKLLSPLVINRQVLAPDGKEIFRHTGKILPEQQSRWRSLSSTP
jgi:hypothetical protein